MPEIARPVITMEKRNRRTSLKDLRTMKKILTFTFLVFIIHSTYSQTEIDLDDYFRTLKSIKVEIEGKTYTFLFDTGGGISLISPAIASEINKSGYGNFVGFRMSGEKIETKLCDSVFIKIGENEFFHPYIGIFDIMRILPEGFKRVDGLISLKTFENEKISLNFKENKLILETEKSLYKRIEKMTLVASRFANGSSGMELNIFTGILFKDHYWWFLFDTGNIAQAKISDTTAKEWGIMPKNERDTSDIGEFVFVMAGDSISAPTIIDHIIYDGALSFDLIQQSDFTISFKEEKIWKSIHNK